MAEECLYLADLEVRERVKSEHHRGDDDESDGYDGHNLKKLVVNL